MHELPSTTVALYDSQDALFTLIHLIRTSDDRMKGECVFESIADGGQLELSEVRWIHKRRMERAGEHRRSINKDDILKVYSGDFVLELLPDDEGRMATRPAMPPVTAEWEGADDEE